jgi:hypothetical protein
MSTRDAEDRDSVRHRFFAVYMDVRREALPFRFASFEKCSLDFRCLYFAVAATAFSSFSAWSG